MTAARKIEPDPVAEAARDALDKADGDVRAATQALELAVRKDRALKDALLEPLISSACYDAVRQACIRHRRKVWTPPAEKLVPSKSGVTGSYRVVHLAAGTLLMFPLPGGKKLAEATRDEISAAADFYATQSKDMAEKAAWLRLVAQSVPANKKAGEVLKEKRLRELQTEARRACE